MLDSRRVIKILHELGSSGMLGALLAHGALLGAATVSDAVAYAAIRHGIDLVARFVRVPSLAVVDQGSARRLGVRGHAGRDRRAIRSEIANEWARLGILLFLIFVNVVLSVWRPKLHRAPRPAPKPAPAPAPPVREASEAVDPSP